VIEIKKIIVITLTLLISIIGIFVVLPSAVSVLGFSGATFFSGEIWRIVTYPLAHVSQMHLIENVIALCIVFLLMMEFEFKSKEFAYVFIGSSLLVAIISGLVVPGIMIVGASLGVYALYGSLTLKGKEYIPLYITHGLFGIIIFLNLLYCIIKGIGFEQPIFHAAGFFSGVGIFIVKDKFKRKKRIFQ